MKKLGLIGLAAASLAAGPSVTAQAGSDGWAAFGGFLGGLILSDIAYQSPRTVYVHSAPVVERTVVVREPYREVIVHQPYREVVVYPPPPVYEVRTARVWVPGAYRYESDYCGRAIRVWSPGYYTTRHHQVRVDYHAYPSHSYYREYRRY
jgi:hypothetical protein